MNNLYDILETSLQDVENGTDLETILARHPDFAEELRPILQATLNAKRMAVPAPSSDVVRRNRAKLLQHAAHLRKVQPAAGTRGFPVFQRLALALGLMLLFFMSGTSLVRAASSALPGDSLYTVKRSWEDVALFFTFNAEARETLELEHENERLEEINELFASGRPAEVEFAGIVTRQNEAGWRVANVLVTFSDQTDLPDQPVQIGAAVRVHGITRGDGIVLAEQIELLPAGAPLPEVEDIESEIEVEDAQATSQPGNENSGSGTEAPEIEVTTLPPPVSTLKIESFEGMLNSISQDVWMIGGIPVNVATAEIKGIPVIGARAKAEGYYRPDGLFVAIKVEIIDNGFSIENINSNTNDDDGNTNSNDNSNDNDDVNTNTNGNDHNDNDDDNTNNENNTNNDNSNKNENDNNNNGG